MIKNRYFVTSSAEGNYIDERFFTSFSQGLMFAAGMAVLMSAKNLSDGQVLIIDRRNNTIKEEFQLDLNGMTADISPRLQKAINRKFRKKNPDLPKKEENDKNELSIVKLN